MSLDVSASTLRVYGARLAIHYLSANIFGNSTLVSSEFPHVVCILQPEAIVEHGSELQRVISALIQEQRHF